MGTKLPPGTLDRFWRDPDNWRGFSYVCREDPRVIVPKRNPIWGWTVNWAHGREAMNCLVAIVVVIGVLGAAAMTRNQVAECVATVLVVAAIVGGCYWLADSSRYEERDPLE